MAREIQLRKFFVYLFNLGLGLLVLDFISKYAQQFNPNFFSSFLNSLPLFAIGFIICLISIPFLMVEWLTLPLGTYSKRIRLYKVIGKLSAITFLTGNWFWRDHTNFTFNESASITFFSGFLLITVLFGWLSGQFAKLISKKRISIEKLSFMKPKSLKSLETNKKIDLNKPIPSRNLIKNSSTTPLGQH
jgi:hypothetical protein